MGRICRAVSSTKIILPAVGLLLAVCLSAHGQTQASGTSRPSSFPDPQAKDEDSKTRTDFGDPTNDIRTKLLIKADKKLYEENVARAKEAGDIATELCDSYEAKKTFDAEDEKKLERLEKLTKRIRNDAGGSDDNDDDADLPKAVEPAVKKVASLAGDLRKEVEKTPRHVISAAVINQANKIIGLIRFLRNHDRR